MFPYLSLVSNSFCEKLKTKGFKIHYCKPSKCKLKSIWIYDFTFGVELFFDPLLKYECNKWYAILFSQPSNGQYIPKGEQDGKFYGLEDNK